MKIIKDIKEILPEVFHIQLLGDVDYVSYPELKKMFSKLISAGHYKLIIDFTYATHIDSSGLGAVTSAHIKANSHGGKILLVNNHKEINKIFDITGLSKVISIYPDIETALGNMNEELNS